MRIGPKNFRSVAVCFQVLVVALFYGVLSHAAADSLSKCGPLLSIVAFSKSIDSSDSGPKDNKLTLEGVRQLIAREHKLEVVDLAPYPGLKLLQFKLMNNQNPKTNLEILVNFATSEGFKMGFSNFQLDDPKVVAFFIPTENFLSIPFEEIKFGMPTVMTWHEIGHAFLHNDWMKLKKISVFQASLLSPESNAAWRSGKLISPLLSLGEIGADLQGFAFAGDVLSNIKNNESIDRLILGQVIDLLGHFSWHTGKMTPAITLFDENYENSEEFSHMPARLHFKANEEIDSRHNELYADYKWISLKDNSLGIEFHFPQQKDFSVPESVEKAYIKDANTLMVEANVIARTLFEGLSAYNDEGTPKNRQSVVDQLLKAGELFERFRNPPTTQVDD